MDKNTEEFLKKLLDAREVRYNRQTNLTQKYNKPIISFMLNIPGIEKRNEKLLKFHKNGVEIIKETLEDSIIFEDYFDEETGMVYMASVDMDALDLKKKMIEIEDTRSGRLYDIDIFDKDMNQITRSKLNLPPRKCIACENNARECIKEKRHTYDELIEIAYKIINA